jgi:regulator of RNase E activity RraA
MLDRLRALDSCAVSDALDTLNLPGATTGICPLWAVREPVVGRARTVLAGPRQSDRPGQHIAAAAIEAADPGDVLVIANEGRTDVSSWGGILTLAARRRAIGGVVIDGACRDIAESEEQGFPVFGRAVVPVSARGRIVQLGMNEPIEFAGVTVHPGDVVLADRNGVVFVPAAELGRVVTLAERIAARESAMADAVRAGNPVTEVMHDSKFPTIEETA